MAPSVKAVGFDLDDTLAVTERPREELLAAALERADATGGSREAYLAAHDDHGGDSHTREPVFEAMLDGEGDPEAAADAYREAIEAALRPLPAAEPVVDELRREYRVGLLTDGPVRAQEGKLAELGWTDLFEVVVVTGSLPATKPDRRTFAALVEELGVDAGEAVYVGDDGEADVVGATRAGMWAVHVVGPESDPHPAADAHLARSALGELPALVERLGDGA